MEQRILVKIATAMRKKRASLGMTQEQAAEYLDISYSSYTKIENTAQSPSLDMLVRICDAYHISLDELLLKWPASRQITPKQTEILFQLLELDPGQLQSCRDIMDNLLAIANENVNA